MIRASTRNTQCFLTGVSNFLIINLAVDQPMSLVKGDKLSQTFAALADPTRRGMLAQLSKGETSVSELARPFLKTMSLQAITKHVQVLERAGLITKSKDAQWRPCKLRGAGLRDAADWVEQYRMFWEESFDRLDAYLKEKTAKKNPKDKTNGFKK